MSIVYQRTSNGYLLFRNHNILRYHIPLPFNTVKSLMANAKDSIKNKNQCGLIYHKKCQDCSNDIFGTQEGPWESGTLQEKGHHLRLWNILKIQVTKTHKEEV